jgi:Secretion system C-terminal sorting domain
MYLSTAGVRRGSLLLTILFLLSFSAVNLWGQCAPPVNGDVTVTGVQTAVICWESGQPDVANHSWNLKVNNLTTSVMAALDMELLSSSPGLSISAGSICYNLLLPDAGHQYEVWVAERCDGPVSELSASELLVSFTAFQPPAEVPPSPTVYQTVSRTITHTASMHDVSLDPNPQVGDASRVQFTRSLANDFSSYGSSNAGEDVLFDIIENILDVDIPDWVWDAGDALSSFGVVDFDLYPIFEFGLDADYGGFMEIGSVGTADVDISYPVDVSLHIPANQQFGCGDKIVIETAAQRGQGAQLTVVPAFYETVMGPIFDNLAFEVNIGLEASIGVGCIPLLGCIYEYDWSLPISGNLLDLPIDVVDELPPFIQVCEDAFAANANLGTLLSCATGGTILEEIVGGINMTPSFFLTSSMFSGSPSQVSVSQPVVPLVTIPEFGGTFKKIDSYQLTQSTDGNKIKLEIAGGELEELSRLRLDLMSLIDYLGYPTSLGPIDLGDLNLNLTTDLVLDYELDPTTLINVDLGVPMQWRVFDPLTQATVANGFSQVVPAVLTGHHIELVLPNDYEQNANFYTEHLMNANFSIYSELEYNNSMTAELLQFSVPGVTSFSLVPEFEVIETEMPGSPKVIENHLTHWEDTDFSKPTGTYQLVPDQMNPIITCKPTMVVLNQWGTASIQPDDVFNASLSFDLPLTGSGQPKAVMVLTNALGCSNVGSTPVSLTVEDGNCNQSTCTATVTVVDNSKPEIACPPDFVIENDPGFCGAYVNIPLPQVFDNCSYLLLARFREVDANNNPLPGPTGSWSAWSSNPSAYYAVGRWSIQWKATDPSANVESCIFYFDVIDTEIPEISCFDVTYVFNGEPHLDLQLSDFSVASDNCEVASHTLDINRIFCEQLGDVITITATAIDIYDNVNTCTSQLTIDGLPCGWSQQADGAGCVGGNLIDYDVPSEVFTVTGTDCYSASPFTADELAFAQYDLCGNGSITAQVIDLLSAQTWAGVTMRESNNPGAKKFQLTTNLESTLLMRHIRSVTHGQSFPQPITGQIGRYWLRIVRQGQQFIGYASSNGSTWHQVGVANIPMSSCIELGLVSYNTQLHSTTNAYFGNVVVTGGSYRPSLVPEGPAGVAVHQNGEFDWAVFPNPTNGLAYLYFSGLAAEPTNLHIRLLSITGEVLQNWQIDQAEATGAQEVNLTNLPKGVYIIQIQGDQLPTSSKRIVVTD